ncbi:MAG: M42 family peptidase, partial [Ferruginibacter sp.]
MAKATRKKSNLNEASWQFLKEYINNPSPVGFECSGQKIWMKYLKSYADEFFTDPYGTAVAVVNPGQSFKVVIEAHADEI